MDELIREVNLVEKKFNHKLDSELASLARELRTKVDSTLDERLDSHKKMLEHYVERRLAQEKNLLKFELTQLIKQEAAFYFGEDMQTRLTEAPRPLVEEKSSFWHKLFSRLRFN